MPQPFNPGRITPPDWEHVDKYPLAPRLAAIQAEPPPDDARMKIACPVVYNQEETPHCVGYGTATLVTAMEYQRTPRWGRQKYNADEAYWWANANDGFPIPHDGSSTRAGFEYLRQQGAVLTPRARRKPDEPERHFIGRYLWARTVDELLRFMWTEKSLGMIGVNWYAGMFSTDDRGFIRRTGRTNGGHNIVVRGFDMRGEFVILRNTWGRWGYRQSGDAFLSFSDLDRLLNEYGEAGVAVDATD